MRLAAALSLLLAWSGAWPGTSRNLEEAISHYYQAQYDASALRLGQLLDDGQSSTRDSLVAFQYLGMSRVMAGEDSAGVDAFRRLLRMDSHWQLPQNENLRILKAFEAARTLESLPESGTAEVAKRHASKDSGEIPQTEPAAIGLDSPGAAEAGFLSAAPPPATVASTEALLPPMSLAMGALPFGSGWVLRDRTIQGGFLGAVQLAGLALSVYASARQDALVDDGVLLLEEEDSKLKWRGIQRISLSVAAGGYLLSLIASLGGK